MSDKDRGDASGPSGRRFRPDLAWLRNPIIIVTALALLLGVGIGYSLGRGNSQAVGREGVATARETHGIRWALFGKPRDKGAARARIAKPDGFAYWRQRVDTSGPEPKACLEMTRPLDETKSYADFVMLSPEAQGTPAVSAKGSELCIGGLGFADRRVTLLKGLPGKGRDTLAANVDVDFVFGEQKPYVGFAGDGVILPREESDGVGIETLNVSKLTVQVWRVPDRNLVRQSIATSEPVEEGDYMGSWGDDYPGDEGTKVWQGEVRVANQPGERITTVFPLGAVLKEMKPGGYIIVARDAKNDSKRPAARRGARSEEDDEDYGSSDVAQARRWVIFTDMAVMSYSGSEGADVVVRSLSTARSLSGVKVALVASNGETLAEGNTDASGRVRFPRPLLAGQNGAHPKMLMAYGAQGDLAILDLDRSPIDLSRQGVGGRTDESGALTGGRVADTAVDGFIYADRGIYRPGETVHVVALVRDRAALAEEARKGELVIYRPSGIEFARYKFDRAPGGYLTRDVALPKSSPRGRWRATLEMDGLDRNSGEMSFSVEDFVPQRLAVDTDAQATRPLVAGETRAVNITARFLYGAPGAGLQTQGEARIQADPNPFPQYKDYRWGDQSKPFDEKALEINSTVTDGAGHAVFNVSAAEAGDTAVPLKAVVTASVFEPGGRPVRESVFLKVRPRKTYFGVKIAETDSRNYDHPFAFDLIAVNSTGQRIAASGVTWTLIRENWSYNWFEQDTRWQWRRTSNDVLIARGTGAISAGTGLAIRRALNWGDYRLEIEGPEGARTVAKFTSGWGDPGREGDAPDLVRVNPGEKAHAQGDNVTLTIKAPYAGEAQIAVATDHIIDLKTVWIGANGGTVTLHTDSEWGGGAYVLVSVVQPRDPSRVPTPRRAMGVAYVSLDPKDHKLGVTIGAVAKQDSRAEVSVPVRVTGAGIGRAHVTVAAVDEGILRLTKFETPDPVKWYFGKRALSVDYRDDYARLLNANLGAPAGVNFGADEIGGEGLTVTPTRTVALWSGVVETGVDGRATVKLPAALFNGELRLMAVAWTDTAVGSTSKAMTVREAVVADLNLPRFMAPGDVATATLELHNLEGRPGQYQASVTASGGLLADIRRSISLPLGERTTEKIDVAGPSRAGIGEVQMAVTGPQFSTSKTYPLQTRLGWGAQTYAYTEEQAAGTTYTPPNSLLDGLQPGSVTMYVSYSPFRGFDPAAVAMALEGYRYGCTEQVVSTAYPLLYADRWGARPTPTSSRGLDMAIQTILSRQSLDGAFGLWTAGDRLADPWLGAYTTDFLLEAKARGAQVPQEAIDRALSAMRRITKLDGYAGVSYKMEYGRYWLGSEEATRKATMLLRSRASAYALYVMAKGGQGDLARLRWWHDVQMKDDPEPLPRAQVAAALAMMGDHARARSALRGAIQAIGYREYADWYQSPLRDTAGVITYAYEAGETAMARELHVKLEGAVRAPDELNTQEQARLLQAAAAMLKDSGPARVTAHGSGAIILPTVAGQPRWGVSLLSASGFTNDSPGKLWRTVTIRGTPIKAPAPSFAGLSLSKTVFALGGGAANTRAMSQGDRVIVRLSGKSSQARSILAVIDDALPAGWEVETVLGPEDAQRPQERRYYYGNPATRAADGPYKFLGVLSDVNVQEKRDDRYVAALNVDPNEPFSVAYIIRAVTPGDFYLPGAEAKDMYRPQINARTEGSRAVIAAR